MTTFGGGRQRLAQQVIDQLRAQIETGTLRVGDQLPTEPQLEATFGVSRTVVREAIADLRSAGFVKPIQGKGVFVADPKAHSVLPLTPVEIKSIPETLELLEFRMAAEGEAAAIAAYRRTAEQEAAIREANRRMAHLIETGQQTVEADYAFHMAMLRSRGVMPLTTLPPIAISPSVISSRPAIIRSSVDFPQPDGPTRATNSPSSISSEMPWMTSTAP